MNWISFDQKDVRQRTSRNRNDIQFGSQAQCFSEETFGSPHSDEKSHQTKPNFNDSQEGFRPENVALNLMDFHVEEGENFSETENGEFSSSYEKFEASEIIEEVQEEVQEKEENPYLKSVFKDSDNFSKIIEECEMENSTRSKTIPSSNPLSSNCSNLDFGKNQNYFLESGSYSETNNIQAHGPEQLNEERKQAEYPNNPAEGEIEEEKKETESNSGIVNGNSPPQKPYKQSSIMKSLVGKYFVALKRAFEYYWTENESQEKYELKSIEHVAKHIRHNILERFYNFITKVTSEEKTYTKCREFLKKNADPQLVQLLREFTACIFYGDPANNFKNEKEAWLDKGITTKKEQFKETLDKFLVIFSLGLRIPIHQIPDELRIYSEDYKSNIHLLY